MRLSSGIRLIGFVLAQLQFAKNAFEAIVHERGKRRLQFDWFGDFHRRALVLEDERLLVDAVPADRRPLEVSDLIGFELAIVRARVQAQALTIQRENDAAVVLA